MTSSSTDSTRSKLRAALTPEAQASEPVARAWGGLAEPGPLQPSAVAGFSVIDCVRDGIDAWWHKSSVGRAAVALTPLVEPHLKPFVRRHYQALLMGSAAAGAIVSHYPGRSTRMVLKVAGPVLLSSIMLEVAKAGLRQLKRRP